MISLKYFLPTGFSLLLGWFLLPDTDANTNEKKDKFLYKKHSSTRVLNHNTPTKTKSTSENHISKNIPTIDSMMAFAPVIDTPRYKSTRFPTFRPKDRLSDPLSSGSGGGHPFGFKRYINTDIQYFPDSLGGGYYFNEIINGKNRYRPASKLTIQEMSALRQREAEQKLLRDLAMGENAESATSGRGLIPKIPVESKWFDRIFGGNAVEFKPVGFVNMDFGVQYQRVANPALPIRQQRNTNFNFDPHANLSLVGKVGEKLRVNGNFDTKASFQFENQFKLEYKGFEEDIIRKIEFGNVSFALPTTLIQGAQNLFGVTTELQFGRLKLRSVFSNQRARAEAITLKGGNQRRNFDIVCGDYEDNRHFFLGQFFRNNYERSLRTLPMITSGVQVTRLEVYVTNRTNNTADLRNIVAYLDLGEPQPSRTTLNNNTTNLATRNDANNLFNVVGGFLNADNATTELQGVGFTNGTDFTVLRASKKLQPSEFVFNPQLGTLSLLTPLRNDEILAVAFEYTLNGQNYKVGELTDDYANRDANQLVRLKMLRPPSIRLDMPTWNLMMKNVYSLNATQLTRNNFLLRIIYKDDLTGIDNPTLQEGVRMKDQALLRVMGLDKLNPQNDPQPDGNFDFVEGVTVDTRNGKIYFPVLEPFGSNLIGNANWQNDTEQLKFDPLNETGLINKYVFDRLYNSTKADALQTSDKNKFFISGNFEGNSASDVTLPGINISPGSVKVTAGGIPLQEGAQFTVDYATGKVQVTDQAVLNSGKDIKIDYEKADLFNFQTRRMFGTRAEYEFNKDFIIGGTLLSLSERPVITRVNTGEEPVNNTMLGFDVTYNTKSRFLTRLVDKLPFIQTKEESSFNFYGEFAQLFPAGSNLSGKISYIDDFEGTRTAFNLGRAPQIAWKLGATPQLFPEAISLDINYGFRRAKMSWYNVDNLFYRDGTAGGTKPANIDIKNHYARAVIPQEVFKNRQRLQIQTNETIFDVGFFPEERGSYNYNPDLTSEGLLKNPRQNWGAITRGIASDIDFDNQNMEYVEFWLMDPFLSGNNGKVLDGRLNQNNTTGGDIYLQLGNISEDVMPDGKHAFENGLPVQGANATNATQNTWGFVTNQQYLNNAFDNDPNNRVNQDVGWDGLKDADEATFGSFQNFVNAINTTVTNPVARANLLVDVSGDNFKYYLGADLDGANAQIVERYKNFNGYDNNSPITSATGGFTPSSSTTPDNEDLNNDNTISNLEGYYQYKISINPANLQVGSKYIIDQVSNEIDGEKVSWYLFRIPIRTFDQKVGAIDGFKSIRYLRMVLTNFQQPAVLRFAQYQFVATQWRRFTGDLNDKTFGLPIEPYDAKFNVSVINIEENGSVEQGVTPYTLPPGAIRDRDVTNINNRQINEQSMRLCVDGLRDRDARAVFRNYSLDLLSYKRVRAYIHASSTNAKDGELSAFVRLGTDFTDNYYEIEVPLYMTPEGTTLDTKIWLEKNWIDVEFKQLTQTKVERNLSGQSVVIPFSRIIDGLDGNKYRITVVGNPDISAVQVSMIGVRNPDQAIFGQNDDKLPKSVCIWIDEFRITDFDQTAGWAVLARAGLKLADFAQINASMSYTTFGFGTISQRISERTRKTTLTYDITATVALDKFLPKTWGIKLPLFLGYERRRITPRYNPLDPDVELASSLEGIADQSKRDEYRKLVEENFSRKSINFTNVRKVRMKPDKIPLPFDIENFAFTWLYTEENRTDINTAQYLNTNEKWAIAYTYAPNLKPWEPFKNAKAKWLNKSAFTWLKEFNLGLLPSNISVRGDIDRRFTKTLFRAADRTTNGVAPLYQKTYTFARVYNMQWSLTKNLSLNYTANALAIIDEPIGEINTREKQDSIWTNIKNLGRMKNYTQQIQLTYKVPLDKFPILNWMSADAGYNVNYNWIAGAARPAPNVLGQADTLGNIINNSRDRTLRGSLDFSKLYKKSRLLKELENPTAPKKDKDKKKDEKKDGVKDSLKKKEKDYYMLKLALRPLLMLKKLRFNYTMTEQTVLPGFKPTPKYFGASDDASNAPGWDFVLGGQNGEDLKNNVIQNNWLATSSFITSPLTQTKRENLTITAELEPAPDFKIQIDVKRTRQANYSELFRFNQNGQIESQNPARTGSYSVSIIAFNTAFIGSNTGLESDLFNKFQENRNIIRDRLKLLNPNAGEYGLNSQDVLIPAFLATYTGNSPNSQNPSPFPKLPLPNWRIDYTGLTKMDIFKKIFQSVSLNHSYNANYTVNNYTSSLEYKSNAIGLNTSETDYPIPNQLNAEGNFVPVYVVGQVTINEKFAPLIGVNIRTKSGVTVRMDYNRDRDLSLNLSNAQLAEMHNKSIVFGFAFTKKNLKLPFRDADRKPIILPNDINMRCDFTIRDTKTIQRKLDQPSVITAGNTNFQIRPSIDYQFNPQLNLAIYFDYSINTPQISSSFQRVSNTGGVQLRYNITQ